MKARWRSWARLLAPTIRAILGPSRYRKLRIMLDSAQRFDEVIIVWRAIGSRLVSGGVMLDVGAHHGESAEIFADLGWQIHCFEPNPANWPQIERRVTGRYRNTHLVKAAVGEVPATNRTFFTSEESSGISSLHSFHESHKAALSVDVTTLADYCAQHDLRKVDFLKVDTEGFDYFVLRGLDWSKVLPTIVVCEFEDRKTESLGYSYHDMADYLVRLGYRVIVSEWDPVLKYGGQHTWRRYVDYPTDSLRPDAWGNLIAIKDRSTEELLLRELGKLWQGKLGAPRL